MGDTSKGEKKRGVRLFSPLSPCWLVTLTETVLLPSPQLLSDDSSFCLFLITLLLSLIASGLGFLLWLISGHLTTPGCSPLTSPQGYFTKIHCIKIKPFNVLMADGVMKNFQALVHNVGILWMIRESESSRVSLISQS